MSALSLDDAKTHLNITTDTFDFELQGTIDAAEARIAQNVGPLTTKSVTCRVPGGAVVVLPVAPAVSLTTMTSPDGAVVDLTTVTLDSTGATIRFTDGITRFWSTVYDVTYLAGWSTVPDDLLYAVKELVRHLWRTQRGAGGRPGASGADQQPAGYLMPYLVVELLEPYIVPGVA